jgi:hypothetical protein
MLISSGTGAAMTAEARVDAARIALTATRMLLGCFSRSRNKQFDLWSPNPSVVGLQLQ